MGTLVSCREYRSHPLRATRRVSARRRRRRVQSGNAALRRGPFSPVQPPAELDLETRKSLLFALAAERLSAYYEHGQWMTLPQGASLASQWLARSKLQVPLSERRLLSELSDQLARHLAATLSLEAGQYTAHQMMESLDPRYRSPVAFDLLDECERLLREATA